VGNFDEAVHEAANGVKPFAQALDDAHRECEDALRYVKTLSAQLKADREALDEVVEAMAQDAKQVEEALSGVTSDATQNLGLVKEAVGHASEEWAEVFHGEETALAGASELLPELGERVKELAEQAEAATHGVLEWVGTVGHELDKAVESVEQAVSVSLGALVADWRRSTEGAVGKLVEFFEKEWPDAVKTKEAEWRRKVDEVHTLMDHTFEEIAAHDQKVKEYAEEEWVELKDAQMKFASEDAHKLADELKSLSQTAENYEGELEVAAQVVVEHQQQAAEAATHLAEGLLEVRGRWGTFGITC
jgi:vacuolar-type H+-ATPase subunit D/Vma8